MAGEQIDPPDDEKAPATSKKDGGNGKFISATAVGVAYGGFATWAYFAWYHNQPNLPFEYGGDGYFGKKTYAGGADKVGHLWAGYALGRITSQILRKGGWGTLESSVVGGGLSLLLFTGVEIKDGYHYQFSPGDQIGNAVGAGLAVLLENVPALDKRFDLRVEYVPSTEFRRGLREDGDIDVANDYSGQMTFLAYHLNSIESLRWSWLRYIDVGVGYRTRNYKPTPLNDDAIRRQELFFGISLNAQELAQLLLGRRNKWVRGTGRTLHGITEYLSIPYTTLPLGQFTRRTNSAAADQRN